MPTRCDIRRSDEARALGALNAVELVHLPHTRGNERTSVIEPATWPGIRTLMFNEPTVRSRMATGVPFIPARTRSASHPGVHQTTGRPQARTRDRRLKCFGLAYAKQCISLSWE